MLEGRNLWELTTKRAAATPDAVMAIDEDGAHAHLRRVPRRRRAGRRGPFRPGDVGEGDIVSWQLPTWIESMVLVGGLARLGAVQNPILPIYRDREVGFVVRRPAGGGLLVVPGNGGASTTGGWRDIAAETAARDHGVAPWRGVLDGDVSTLSRARRRRGVRDGSARTVRWRWLFYTSGTTADPKGARHTDNTVAASAVRWSTPDLQPEDRNALVFPFTHIGGIGWLPGLMAGLHVIVEGFVPDTTIPVLERERRDHRRAGTSFHLAYLAAQRGADHPLFPSTRIFGWRCGQAAAAARRGEGPSSAASASSPATGSPSARSCRWPGRATDEQMAYTEGRAAACISQGRDHRGEGRRTG